MKLFNNVELTQLRIQMGQIDRVDPCGEAYTKLCTFLDDLPRLLLEQLAGAQIKFISVLAQNRLT